MSAVIVNFQGRYFILWDIVDPPTESNHNLNPNPEPKSNPNPDNCGFTISHKMKYLRFSVRNMAILLQNLKYMLTYKYIYIYTHHALCIQIHVHIH